MGSLRKNNILNRTDKGKVISSKILRANRDEIEMRNAEFYHALIENSLDIKTIIDKYGRVIFISNSVENILGYTPQELLGKKIIDIIDSNDKFNVFKQFVTVLHYPENICLFEINVRNKKGDLINLECKMKNLIKNPDVSGIIINSRDITGKKSAEKTIKTLMAISEKLNSTLDIDKLIDDLVIESIKLLDTEGGTAGLKTFDSFISKRYYNLSEIIEFEFIWPQDKGVPSIINESKKVYISNDTSTDKNIYQEFTERFKIHNLICAPVFDTSGTVIGFLELCNKKDGKKFINSDIEKLRALSQSAATAIQNAIAYQKMKSTELQLKYSREQLRRLSAHLQSAREEERTRISREIHDELGQALTGLKMDLSWVEKKIKVNPDINEQIFGKFKSMSLLIDDTIKSIRKISAELRPGVLDYLGLTAAIEWQAQDFQNRTGIVCRFTEKPRELNLDQQKSTAIFRIFQETLTNIARHSSATEVEITLTESGDSLCLQVKDNGRGITENEILKSSSFGLLGMRERADLLGGEFNIKGLDSGTMVTVNVPIINLMETGEDQW